MKKTRKTKQLIAWDLNSPESLEMFRKAAKEFTDQVIESKTAMDLLVREGIYTKTGKLTKNYR